MDAVAGPMMRQMKSLGLNVKFMGGDGICSAEFVKLAAGAVSDNQVFCAEAGGIEGKNKAALDAFKVKFKSALAPMCRCTRPMCMTACS